MGRAGRKEEDFGRASERSGRTSAIVVADNGPGNRPLAPDWFLYLLAANFQEPGDRSEGGRLRRRLVAPHSQRNCDRDAALEFLTASVPSFHRPFLIL